MTTGEADFLSTFGLSAPPAVQVEPGQVVVVVLVYNEMLRLPAFLKHYRNIGIEKFIFVDNASVDGTADYLKAQADVVLISTQKPFKSYKSTGRELIADTYLAGHWVLFPDADELLVYPGWPDLSVPELVEYLQGHGFEALFTTMVDMYAEGGLSEMNYASGDDLIEACPNFDPNGYRFNPLKGSHGKRFETPVRHVFGGTRERIFHTEAKRSRTALDNLIIRLFFSIRSKAPATGFRRKLDRLVLKLIKNSLPDPAAVQSKVQFLKWKKGLKFSGSVHNVRQNLELAPDWAALLHFKYLNDYALKVAEALERKQHTDNSGHYLDYHKQLETLQAQGLSFEESQRFEGDRSLLACGLMRESQLLKTWRRNAKS
ncbi:glycosyltransferase family 2 protein [Roseibium sp.]|uniref:glycosyltransferase family 2 protein n=1 Tax=Roseibium sp. TaxID=1936156 RepID=UPI003BB1A621